MIGLCDCNNFYVSCERVFDPSLERRPVAVLSNNDGCLIARSQEVKDVGIAMGTPAFKLPPDVRRSIVLRSSNYALYGDLSRRVMATLGAYCPAVETYSIDEAFLFLDGFEPDALITHCRRLRQTVKRNVGIPVSIGLSTSRTLAKLANHEAKKNPAHRGVCWLDPHSTAMETLLSRLPVNELWGVSRRLADRLAVMGITTAWQLREADPKRIRARFSVVQEKLVWELRGHDCIETENVMPKQNIMTSRSFGNATTQWHEVREAVRLHAQHGAEKLRRQSSVAQGVMVFIQTNRHRSELPQYSPSIVVPLSIPSNDSAVILDAVKVGLAKIWRAGYQYVKAGVMMLDLIDAERTVEDIFDEQSDADRERRQGLMAAVDKLNQQWGRDTITFGGQRKAARWHLRREFLSQRYTTSWQELAVAKA
ncbi:Y-family DNA polymerase [Carnimonas bestiolae]|uniref:Y-family DNA polymerase n=1 Tax=Carnimonas bestiolae TaxID=3402172 RepID=UPI003EDBE602